MQFWGGRGLAFGSGLEPRQERGGLTEVSGHTNVVVRESVEAGKSCG